MLCVSAYYHLLFTLLARSDWDIQPSVVYLTIPDLIGTFISARVISFSYCIYYLSFFFFWLLFRWQICKSVFYFKFWSWGNFRCTETSVGVETQLCNLASITQVIDPKLHQHLGTSSELIFYYIHFSNYFSMSSFSCLDICWWNFSLTWR